MKPVPSIGLFVLSGALLVFGGCASSTPAPTDPPVESETVPPDEKAQPDERYSKGFGYKPDTVKNRERLRIFRTY